MSKLEAARESRGTGDDLQREFEATDLQRFQTAAPPLAGLVDEYLRVLQNERGSSEHTLRAYRRELMDFARVRVRATCEPLFRADQIEHLAHSHVSGRAAGARAVESFNRTRLSCNSQLVQMAGAHWACSAECGITGSYAEIAQASAASAVD